MGARRRTKKLGLEQVGLGAAVLLTVGLSLPVWPVLAENMVVAAVAVAMPEGGIHHLKQRFAPQVVEEAPPMEVEEPERESLPQPKPEETPSEEEPQQEDEPIPEEYRGTLLRETMVGAADGSWLDIGEGWLRNYTALSFGDITEALEQTPLLTLKGGEEPEVLIVHTHATESYETHTGPYYDTRSDWRTREEDKNMCAIGEIMAEELEAAGIGVLHDTTQHDHPSYNGSYDRSRATVEELMAEHPSIKVVLDVHRDAIQRDETTIVAPVTTIEGKSCAQVMIIAGCDDGTMNMPNWRQNLRFGAEVVNQMEEDWPTLARPLFFAYRKYNQDMAPGALLVEVGSNANTFEEAAHAARLTAKSLAKVLLEMEEEGS